MADDRFTRSDWTAAELARCGPAKFDELIDGRLVERRSSIQTSSVLSHVLARLFTAADESGEATMYSPSLGYHCFPWTPEQVLRPKGSLVRRGRLSPGEGARDADFMTIPADLAIETVSRYDTAADIAFHVREYLRAGFGQVWVVDATAGTVTVHRRGATPAVHRAGDEITAEPALALFRCKVAEFFE